MKKTEENLIEEIVAGIEEAHDVCTDNGCMTIEDYSNLAISFDITQRNSTATADIVYHYLFNAMQKINSTKKKVGIKGFKSHADQSLETTDIILVSDSSTGNLLCVDGGHRTKTIQALLNGTKFMFPKKADEPEEKFMMALRETMIEEGYISSKETHFTFDKLPLHMQEKILNYNIKVIQKDVDGSEIDLSNYCGYLFRLANAGKSIKTNDKLNATYASTQFFALIKQVAEYASKAKTKIEDFPLLMEVFNTEELSGLLQDFKAIARKHNKKDDALLKVVIRSADNAYWNSTKNYDVISEICTRHLEDDLSKASAELIEYMECFVEVAKELDKDVTCLNKINVWPAIAHTFGQVKIDNSELDSELLPKNMKFKATRCKDMASKLVSAIDHEVTLIDGTTKAFPASMFETSSQNFQNTKSISDLMFSIYHDKFEVNEPLSKR